MAQQIEKFPNAPITEAVLDIYVDALTPSTLARLETFGETVKDRYPKKEEQSSGSIVISVTAGGQPAVQHSPKRRGFSFHASDGKQIIHARLDGFSFSRLRPYDSWSVFVAEAKELWSLYREAILDIRVQRLSLRYLNRIPIPATQERLIEYLALRPEVPKTIGWKQFFLNIGIPDLGNQISGTVRQTYEKENPATGILPVILDIQVLRVASLASDSDELWRIFDLLRDAKNEIFFSSLTAKTRELFR